MRHHPIDTAASKAGGFAALAKLLGVSKSAVHQWKGVGRRVPIEHCPGIEHLTGVTRQELRPNDWREIWPELADTESADDRAGHNAAP